MKFDVPFKVTVTRNSMPPPEMQAGTIVANRFRLVRKVGEGGMGSVWLADHLALGIQCAVKFAEGELRYQPDTLARFEREARVEAQLRSPHVVHVYDHGTWNRTPFIAMEYLRGESLATQLERVGRLDYMHAHRVVAHAARALTRAHALGVVHRDLKPENILFVQEDDGETAKLLDFGVAKWASEWAVTNLTKVGLLVGTPLYMSPEQARGTKDIDGRSDLWSLAVIAYQCLTGDLPFVSDGLGELLGKIMFEPIPVPSQVLPTLPPEVDAWWLKAASRDPAGRFQTAKELSDALAVALKLERPTPVAEAPAGMRGPMAMSDDGLSVSGPGFHESRGGHNPRSTTGRNAKLIAVGLVGVVAMTMVALLGKSTGDMKSSTTANGGVAVPTASPSAAPAKSALPTAVQVAAPTAAPSGRAAASETASAARTEPIPDAPKPESRRAKSPPSGEPKRAPSDSGRPAAPTPEPVEHKPASPPPPKNDSPAADFGI